MKFFVTIIFLWLCVFASSAFAQEARKVDEFGNLTCDSYLARMDEFLLELNNVPNSNGYVLVYEGKILIAYDDKGKYIGNQFVLPKRREALSRILTMKNRLKFKKVSPEKITFIEGGFRENYTVEFWIVPEGAQPPQPTPTLSKMRYRKGGTVNFCRDF